MLTKIVIKQSTKLKERQKKFSKRSIFAKKGLKCN